jgi:tRNA threonylcarbamoyladenosine biosynthesis protein TsaE
MRFESSSVEQTRAAGAAIAAQTRAGDVIAMIGTLGAGKTEFVRGFVAALNPQAIVRSPTFSLVNSYATPGFTINHFDFYRLNRVDELTEIGFEEYLWGGGVCLIEWADLFPAVIPAHARRIRFTENEQGVRVILVDEWRQS